MFLTLAGGSAYLTPNIYCASLVCTVLCISRVKCYRPKVCEVYYLKIECFSNLLLMKPERQTSIHTGKVNLALERAV